MTSREILLTLHIIFVAGWLGTDLLLMAISPQMDRQSPEAELAWARQNPWFHERYYPMVAVGVLITGILLVLDTPWKWTSGFVWVGVGAIVLGATAGGQGIGRLSRRRLAALESGDTATAATAKRTMSKLSLALMLAPIIAILAMVDKWQAAI
jgi:hypothetical protein